MPALPSLPLEEFAAPIGRRVRLITLLAVLIVPVAMLCNVGLRAFVPLPPKTFWPMLLAPLVGWAIVLPIVYFQRVLRYRLVDRELEVVRARGVNRFALAGLEDATVDPNAMNWSVKILGNDGAGAITGRFRNKKLGAYQALVTDRARTVVLRWPDRTLVVSPDRPQDFVDEVKVRAGLRR
ncbi:MAG TPA: PH domain-containing protein [Opitutaceae bacterium]|nr:PH domain-containing protein [Opitutaceae bacterium]